MFLPATPSFYVPSALILSDFKSIFWVDYFRNKQLGSPHRSKGWFPFHPPASVYLALPPSDSPSAHTLLLHEALAIDPSDNPVFHIVRLILTRSLGADARTILQVLEHADYERGSLIYILPEPRGSRSAA